MLILFGSNEIGFLVSLEDYNKAFTNEFDESLQSHLFYCEGNLAICLRSIPAIMREAFRLFNSLRLKLHSEYNQEIHQLIEYCTRVIVILNAKNYTAWNTRKDLILKSLNREDALHFELSLINLSLGRYPKTCETWAHRRWVLEKLQMFDLDTESRICSKAAESHKRNYYAWSHRLYIMLKEESIESVCHILTLFESH